MKEEILAKWIPRYHWPYSWYSRSIIIIVVFPTNRQAELRGHFVVRRFSGQSVSIFHQILFLLYFIFLLGYTIITEYEPLSIIYLSLNLSASSVVYWRSHPPTVTVSDIARSSGDVRTELNLLRQEAGEEDRGEFEQADPLLQSGDRETAQTVQADSGQSSSHSSSHWTKHRHCQDSSQGAKMERMDRKVFRQFLHGSFNMTDDILLDRIFKYFNTTNDGDITRDEWVVGFNIFLKGFCFYSLCL